MGHATVQILTYGTYIENQLASRGTQNLLQMAHVYLATENVKIRIWLSASPFWQSKNARHLDKSACVYDQNEIKQKQKQMWNVVYIQAILSIGCIFSFLTNLINS